MKAQQILKALFRNATSALFQNKKLKRNTTYAIAEVALCGCYCALPTSGRENVQPTDSFILKQFFRFEEDTGTGGKIRSFNFCSEFVYIARATNILKHFSLVLDSAFDLEPNIHVIRE